MAEPSVGSRPLVVVLALGVIVLSLLVGALWFVNYLFEPGSADWVDLPPFEPEASEFEIAVRVPCSTSLEAVDAEWQRNGSLWIRAELANDGLVPWEVPLVGSQCDGRVPGQDYEYVTVLVQLGEPVGHSLQGGCGPGCDRMSFDPPASGWPEPQRTITPDEDWRVPGGG